MARTHKMDRRFADAVRELEEGVPIGKIPLPPKDKRAKSSSANHRAGRGGRRAKALTKVFRAKTPPRKVSCYVSRR